jgi:hypothetical protein
MARATVEYLDLTGIAAVPLTGWGLPLGWRGAVLSEDDDSGALSAIADVAPLWSRPESGAYLCDIELLVLEGSLAIGSTTLRAGDYAAMPGGRVHGALVSDTGARFLFMTSAAPVFAPASATETAPIETVDVRAMPWSDPPGFEGRSIDETPPGLRTKWLKHPTDSDPGYTLLAFQAPGWSDPRLEAHECWEELLLLQGDYLMGVNGAVEAGCYIFRNGDIPHGPQATRAGSVWFCRGDKMIDFDLHDTDWAPQRIAQFFATPPSREPLAPWGEWMATTTNPYDKE